MKNLLKCLNIFILCYFVVATMAFFIFIVASSAQDYPLGSEGLKTATFPPKGVYYIMYNQYYRSDDIKDADGDSLDVGFDVKAFVMAHRLVWSTGQKILGADYGLNIILPMVSMSLEMDASGIDDSNTNIGDIVVEPVVLSWHKSKFDALLAFAVYLPCGDYDTNQAANIGSDHYTFQATSGTTLYFDPKKEWSLGCLFRYEKHMENQSLDLTCGDDLDLEFGFGKKINLFDVGISGYAHWQVTKDKGNAASTDEKDRIFALGPEVQYTIPSIKGQIVLKYYKEFGAQNTKEGDAFWLKLIKVF